MIARRLSIRCLRRRLANDARGATILEFALIAPVFVTILMFLFDTGYFFYARSILGGEIQRAGRASGLETATQANRNALDANVSAAVRQLVPGGALQFQRTAYKSYARAQSKAEAFTDTPSPSIYHDGICNNNEAFDDANANGVRDLDSGLDGQGGAKDVTVYTATLTYDRLFPLAGLLGWNQQVSMKASTILRNQPFDKQAEPVIGHCP